MAQNNEQNKAAIFVERETFERGDKTYYTYFIKGMIRGKEVRVQVQPHDPGGYTVLDIVFGGADKAELFLTPYEITDEKTKRTISGNTYGVRTVDENGEIWQCPIKPYRTSDKTLLQMLLR